VHSVVLELVAVAAAILESFELSQSRMYLPRSNSYDLDLFWGTHVYTYAWYLRSTKAHSIAGPMVGELSAGSGKLN